MIVPDRGNSMFRGYRSMTSLRIREPSIGEEIFYGSGEEAHILHVRSSKRLPL